MVHGVCFVVVISFIAVHYCLSSQSLIYFFLSILTKWEGCWVLGCKKYVASCSICSIFTSRSSSSQLHKLSQLNGWMALFLPFSTSVFTLNRIRSGHPKIRLHIIMIYRCVPVTLCKVIYVLHEKVICLSLSSLSMNAKNMHPIKAT